jgi:hypothetical protein
LTSHTARQERDPDEWEKFQAAPAKLADSILLDNCFSRVDIVLRSPTQPEVTIGIEVERIRTPETGRKPDASPLIHGLGQAALVLKRRHWAVLAVYWPRTLATAETRDERTRLRATLEGWFRDGRVRVVIVP